jgi:hypothetical protein
VVLAVKLQITLQNPTRVVCTEDPSISGTSYRVDAYVETPTDRYLLEAKLSLSTGAALGRKLLTKAEATLNTLSVRDAALLLIVPQQYFSTAERRLKEYIIRAIYGHTNEKLDENNLVLSPQLGKYVLTLTARRKYKALRDTLRKYKLRDIAVLAI